MRFALAMVGLLLAACPKKNPTGPAPAAGVGCPPANGVYIASYLAPEAGAKARAGWVLPLHDATVPSLDGVPDFAQIDANAARAAGVPEPPASLWLMLPNQAPCKVTYGSYYAAAIDAPTKNIAYGIELSGCAAPANTAPETAVALASPESPGQCSIVAPKLAGARVGEIAQDGKWSAPAKATVIPSAVDAQIPTRECTAPACEKLYSIGQVELVANKPIAWAALVNWLAVGDPAKQCEWTNETWSGFFVAGAGGAPVKVTDGQEHPLALFGVLADRGGAKVVLAVGPGEYTAYDYVNGAVTVGRHLVWLRPHPDSYEEILQLGPDCHQEQ